MFKDQSFCIWFGWGGVWGVPPGHVLTSLDKPIFGFNTSLRAWSALINRSTYRQAGQPFLRLQNKWKRTGIINLEVSILSVCLDALINSWCGYNFQTSLKIWNLLCIHSLNQTCGCAFKSSIFILVTAAIPSKSSLRGDVTCQWDAELWHGAFYWEFVELTLWMTLFTLQFNQTVRDDDVYTLHQINCVTLTCT